MCHQYLLLLILWGLSAAVTATEQATAQNTQDTATAVEEHVESLKEPLYNPFVERYVLDELKQLRMELAAQRVELTQQVVDRELRASTRAIDYATETVTYFFYLIAGASSILVLVGWTSFRDIKERVQNLADEEIEKVVDIYEKRLLVIEEQLRHKTEQIDANREEILRAQKIQSLWLRAEQESLPDSKIAVYDQILALRPNDCEAITYKADAALELNEPRWAINLCRLALMIDEKNTHAFYQLACAHSALGEFDEAIRFLKKVLEQSEAYQDTIKQDGALKPLRNYPAFQELLKSNGMT